MFGKLMNKLREAAEARAGGLKRCIPQVDDPLAGQIDWSPLARGGANFRTHQLVRINPSRLQFRATLGSMLFGLVFVGFGVLALLLTLGDLGRLAEGEEGAGLVLLFPALFGLVFLGAGLGLMWHFRKPITFDLANGFFWKGRKDPSLALPAEQTLHATRLSDVHALQIVSEYCTGQKRSSYYSYELNLVLHDGSRVNVIDHGKADHIRDEARQIAELLKVPVWDAGRT